MRKDIFIFFFFWKNNNNRYKLKKKIILLLIQFLNKYKLIINIISLTDIIFSFMQNIIIKDYLKKITGSNASPHPPHPGTSTTQTN